MNPKSAVDKLTRLLEAEDLDVRRAAIRVVAEIGLDSRTVLDSLRRNLQGDLAQTDEDLHRLSRAGIIGGHRIARWRLVFYLMSRRG